MNSKIDLATAEEKLSSFIFVPESKAEKICAENDDAEKVRTEEIGAERLSTPSSPEYLSIPSSSDHQSNVIPLPTYSAPAIAHKEIGCAGKDSSATMAPPTPSGKNVNSKNFHETYDLKQLFNYLYFGAAALAVLEVSRSGADIKSLLDFFYLGTFSFDSSVNATPVASLSACFLLLSILAAKSAVKATARDSSPHHFSRLTRKILRTAAIILPLPFMALTLMSAIGYGYLIQADNAYTAGKDDDAINYLSSAEKADPGLKQKVLSGKAMAYYDKFEYATALNYAQQALNLDPNDANALRIQTSGTYKDPQKALDDAKAFTLRNPNDGHAFRELAEKAYAVGNYEEALPAARRHAALHHEELGAKQFLAEVLLHSGKLDEALQVSTAVLKTDNSSEAHELQSRILFALGRSVDATEESVKSQDMSASAAAPAAQ